MGDGRKNDRQPWQHEAYEGVPISQFTVSFLISLLSPEELTRDPEAQRHGKDLPIGLPIRNEPVSPDEEKGRQRKSD